MSRHDTECPCETRYQYVYHELFLKSSPGVLNGNATFVVSEQCPRGSIKLHDYLPHMTFCRIVPRVLCIKNSGK